MSRGNRVSFQIEEVARDHDEQLANHHHPHQHQQHHRHHHHHVTALRSLLAAMFYGVCSISLNFLNKAVVSSFEFNFPFVIMTSQMSFTVLFLELMRMSGKLSSLKSFSWPEARRLLPASSCFALHATFSLSALHGMNIPMYGAIKRCTPIVSLILGVLLLHKDKPSKSVVVSVVLITVGCLVATVGDLAFDQKAYLCGLGSVVAQGSYLTLIQRSSEHHQKSTLEMVHLNSINTLPFFVGMALITDEFNEINNRLVEFSDWEFWVVFQVLVISGSLLTFSQFLCASVNSALTTTLVGVAKSVVQTIIGFFVFGGVHFHLLNVLGLVLNLAGGCGYTMVKYKEAKSKPSPRLTKDLGSASMPMLIQQEDLDDDDSSQGQSDDNNDYDDDEQRRFRMNRV